MADQNSNNTAIALTIAGSDSGGGAGIQADLKAFSALGVYGASVITAITAQNTRAVTAVEALSPALITAQIDAVFDDLAVDAVKIGMLASVPVIEAVAEALDRALSKRAIPVVLDPVMVAKSGDALLEDAAIASVRDVLLPRATVLTPNLPEAARLTALPEAGDEAGMVVQGEALLGLGANTVLMKGGHARGEHCVDLLLSQDHAPLRFTAKRVATRNTHGTGCTLSSAIAAGLAKGFTLETAATEAHAYLQNAIRAADTLSIGSGHGPVHHFHAVWGAPA